MIQKDYLALATLSILGVDCELVMKVAPGQPSLLGLDALMLLGMTWDCRDGSYEISSKPKIDPRFRLLSDHVQKFNPLSFVPLSQLPDLPTEPAPSGSQFSIWLGDQKYFW